MGLTRKEVNAILSEVDENHDGEVSYEEFIPICFNILVERFKVGFFASTQPPYKCVHIESSTYPPECAALVCIQDEVMSNQVLQSSDQLEQELLATLNQYDEAGSGK